MREQGHKMAELTINAEDVRNALNEFAASYEPGNAERVEVGRVVSASDGIARVEGLPSVMANEPEVFRWQLAVRHKTHKACILHAS